MSIDIGIGLDVLVALSLLAFAYFIVVNAIFIVFTAVAWRQVTHYRRARDYSGAEEAFASPLTPPISVLLPAYNEEAGIVESVRSLLALRYPELEVIVVNDGSRDDTLSRLVEAFDLVPARRASRATLPTAPLKATYASRRHPELWVLDKENGGKAGALNAGVNAARYPYFCVVDADALLEEDALLRVAKPLLDDPDVVIATGGIVRIANGCRIEHGRVVEVALPRSRIAALQVVEYFRAFLVVASAGAGWGRYSSSRARSDSSAATSSPSPAAIRRRPSARTWSSWCACTTSSASGGKGTESSSSRIRSPGRRLPSS